MLVWAECDCLGPVYMSVCLVLQCYDLFASALTWATELGIQQYVFQMSIRSVAATDCNWIMQA
jgi:hypothetical protein